MSNIIVVCAWCVDRESWPKLKEGQLLTPTICPECLVKVLTDQFVKTTLNPNLCDEEAQQVE